MALIATGVTHAALKATGKKLVRHQGRQILLLAADDEVFAIANRCPHEGYPLSEGTLGADCVLTCNWHNWKFDLRNAKTVVGRDRLHHYRLEERQGEIFVDLAQTPPALIREQALDAIAQALDEYDRPRLARDCARLMRAGFAPEEALREAIILTHTRFENGMTHAQAAAADWLALADRAPDPDLRLAATLEPLAHLSWDSRGADHYPFTDALRPFDAASFVAAVLAEDEERAVAHIRGAEQRQLRALRPAFARAALAHYADFGHSAIYVLKSFELITRLGESVSLPLLLLLTRSLVRATREDLLPEFRGFGAALKAWPEGGFEPIQGSDLIGLNPDRLLNRLLVSSRRPVQELYDALMEVAAYNLLHFDLSFDEANDGPLADNVSWLDFTHALTFANAARQLCTETPALWPSVLLQLGLFVARNCKYVSHERSSNWQVADSDTFLSTQLDSLYDHGIAEPIVACHRLKVLFALQSELAQAAEAPWAALWLAAVHRYLSSPLKRHHSLRLARQALHFVASET
ncbi:MAG: Rieske (2Fe-2S) protein [Rhizomicrobium sp.]